jgi:hypothetical protein
VNVPSLAEFSVGNLYEDAMKDAWIARYLPDPSNKPLNREYLCNVSFPRSRTSAARR